MKRESTREYVMQIRKIFMTGFAIQNKKEETRNLEDYIKSEEDKLANAKTVFKEDQEKFDKYHMNLKQQASKMSKDLEKELKRKIQKLTDIQELREEIKLIEVDINKKKQEFEDLQACRNFLIKLRGPQGPPASVSLTRSQMSSRHPLSRMQQQSLASKRKESTISTYSKQKQFPQTGDAAVESSVFLTGMKEAASGSLERTSDFSRQKLREQMSPSPGPISTGVVGEKLTQEEAKYYLDSDDDHAVPFEDPKELLEIVQEIEEKNLFLIDIEQNNENTLEKMVRNYEGELKIVKKQHTEIKNNVKSLEEKLKIMNHRQDKLKREIKTLQNGGTTTQGQATSPRRGGPANSRGQSSLGNNELVLSSTQHIDRVRKEVQDVYKLCEKNPNHQASLLEMLKTIELHVQTMNMQREYMMKKEGGVHYVTKREEEFKNNRRLDKTKQHRIIEKEKLREREKRLEKKKEQRRFVFRGHQDVFRTKPVQKKQKESSQNKGNKQQEEIVKYLELNTASETGRQLMESLLASSAQIQSHSVEPNRSTSAFKMKKDNREMSNTKLSQGGTQRNVDSRGTKGISESSSKQI